MNIKKRIEALENKSQSVGRPLTEEEVRRYERAKALSNQHERAQPGFNIATVARMAEPTRQRIEELRRAMY